MVLIGRSHQLPQRVEVDDRWLQGDRAVDSVPELVHHNVQLNSMQLDLDQEATQDVTDSQADDDASELPDLDWLDESNLEELQAFVGSFGDPEANNLVEPCADFMEGAWDSFESDDLLPEPSINADIPTIAADFPPETAAIGQCSAAANPPEALPTAADAAHAVKLLVDGLGLSPETEATPAPTTSTTLVGDSTSKQSKTVRVSAEQLQQLNTLFGKLIVERNSVNLRLSQLHGLLALMGDRMEQLEQSNQQLRHWYDRASMEGLVAPAFPQTMDPCRQPLPMEVPLASPFSAEPRSALQQQFDALDLDHYTDLHIISQEQMERLVQLQEVASDITLSLREASTATADLNYTTRALQSGITKMQMRPFNTLVRRFPRMMRDLSLQHHKPVNLVIEGETTLIDQVAVEALTDPLTHLLRNAFDHGIETPEERLAAGKPATGTITLAAIHQGNQTLITLQDDGRGIDLERIRSRLRRLGMVDAEVQQLRDRELLAMIFEPGFSTVEQVTELSGRGVGMDVVRTNLQQIRGDIRVDTRWGQGTTFTIQVPQAVSVLRVMLVESARLVFAIPVDSLKAMVNLPGAVDAKAPSLTWEGQTVDLLHPEDWLQFNSPGRQRHHHPGGWPGNSSAGPLPAAGVDSGPARGSDVIPTNRVPDHCNPHRSLGGGPTSNPRPCRCSAVAHPADCG
jgi:chemosensory pili system protein ChpA (sensor histidine kinase/response regulator)